MINDLLNTLIRLQQINKAVMHKLKDTLIQWNEYNIPEFFTTPVVFFSDMNGMPLMKTAGEVKNSGIFNSFYLINVSFYLCFIVCIYSRLA